MIIRDSSAEGVGGRFPSSHSPERPPSTRESVVRVLLVEDSEIDAEFVRGLLAQACFTTHPVTRVCRLSEALSVLEEKQFDVLLLDLELPDSSGLETLNRVHPRAEALALPIVVMTGKADESIGLEAIVSGAQDYLLKGSVQVRILIRTIQHAIDRQRLLNRLKEAEEREQYVGTHDRLTGLPNRYLFIDRLSQSLHTARRHRQWLGVLFLDLDRFGSFNDTLGHLVGDQLLQVVARRLLGCLRATDTAARISGDLFAILLPYLSQGLDAAKVAQNIERCLASPFRLGGGEVQVTASVGIAMYPEDGGDVESLMNGAEAAMRSAKGAGGDRRRFYTARMNASSSRQLTIEGELRRAIEIEQEQLVLYFQPIVNGRTGRIVAAEALMRWNHPALGMISPGEFIPIAETRALIIALGSWALRRVCQHIRIWKDAGYRPIRVGVNVSPAQFWDADFLGLVMQTLLDTGIDGASLELEITEGCVMRELELLADALSAVRQLQVQTSIDDFGTGFSSLNVLRRLPLDTLKIDRSFVRECPQDRGSSTIITAIIGLAMNLGMKVVAEGVETESQRRFLIENGCHTMQGFLFSRPLPEEEFARLLADETKLLNVAQASEVL